MRRFEVIVAPAAAQQARVISEWWRANRAAADLFDEELEAILERLAVAPERTAKYRESNRRTVRRLLMPRTSHHVYFEVDAGAGTVNVLAVWHTARGKGPPL